MITDKLICINVHWANDIRYCGRESIPKCYVYGKWKRTFLVAIDVKVWKTSNSSKIHSLINIFFDKRNDHTIFNSAISQLIVISLNPNPSSLHKIVSPECKFKAKKRSRIAPPIKKNVNSLQVFLSFRFLPFLSMSMIFFIG